MIKLSECPVNTLIETQDSDYVWWIKDSDLFWTPIYARDSEAQETDKISNDEVDDVLLDFVIKSIPVGYSLPEEPAEFTEKRQKLAAFLLYMGTGQYWDETEGVDNFHVNYTKDADDILRLNPHLLGLETREALGLD